MSTGAFAAGTAGRRLISSIGGHARAARYDGKQVTAAATAARTTKLNAQLLAEIDEREPGLPEVVRQERLGHARSEYFRRLRLAAMKKQQAKTRRRVRKAVSA